MELVSFVTHHFAALCDAVRSYFRLRSASMRHHLHGDVTITAAKGEREKKSWRRGVWIQREEEESEAAADKESIMKLCSAPSVKGSNLLIKDTD